MDFKWLSHKLFVICIQSMINMKCKPEMSGVIFPVGWCILCLVDGRRMWDEECEIYLPTAKVLALSHVYVDVTLRNYVDKQYTGWD